MPHTTPTPGEIAPDLTVECLGGPALDLSETKPRRLSIVFFYRGVHCPLCRRQLEELVAKRADFDALGFDTHAVSMDSRERAERQKAEWALGDLPIGYGMSEASARAWGLFISPKVKEAEPPVFAEPGIAVLYPDKRIFALFLQSVPFGRPELDTLKDRLEFCLANDYPIRGSLAG